MEIKPIETHYNGYRFRSRLEARWAVFFDAAGIKYEYEPEGFEVRPDINDNVYRYLPDFYLPDYDLYVEVKPTFKKLTDDQGKLAYVVSDGPMNNGLLVLGQIPNIPKHEKMVPKFLLITGAGYGDIFANLAMFYHKKLCNSDEIHIMREEFDYIKAPNILELDFPNDLYVAQKTFSKYMDGIWWEISEYNMVKSNVFFDKCFAKAREARFEYGDTPKVLEVM